MNVFRTLLPALLVATASLPVLGGEDPLLLEDALRATAAIRSPQQVLAATRDMPLLQVRQTRLEGIEPRAALRIEVMTRFFDVLLVDMESVALGERMSVAYGQWERLKARNADSAESARAYLAYRELYAVRNKARMHQRLARSVLAIALERPGQLPSELVEPDFPDDDTPSYESLEALLQQQAMTGGNSAYPHALTATALELDWLLRAEKPRARAHTDLVMQLLDEARDRLSAGLPSDLGNTMAATVDAQRGERIVAFAIQIAKARLAALAENAARQRKH